MVTLSHTSQNTLSKTKFQLESRVSFSYISNVTRPHYWLPCHLYLVVIEQQQQQQQRSQMRADTLKVSVSLV